jgi:F420-0:gamma-glutamyl ligase
VWKPLPSTNGRDYGESFVRVPSDYEQPPAVSVALLFDPQPAGIYDIEWIIAAGTVVSAGETVARAYRITDGLAFAQTAPFALQVTGTLVTRNRRAVAGDALLRCVVPSLSLDLEPFEELIADARMELFQAANAAFKGLMAFYGEGGQIAEALVPVSCQLHPQRGLTVMIGEIVDAVAASGVESGDVIVISEKVFAIAQGRLFPLALLYANDPKATDSEGRADLLREVARYVPDVSDADLLLADALPDWPDGPMATCGVRDANGLALRVCEALAASTGERCDVVISDTDTGAEIREQVIGCPTIGATPLGATGGLVLYECMRAACAAEFVRGSSRGIPIVICKPHERRRARTGLAQARYPGMLDARRERLVGFA